MFYFNLFPSVKPLYISVCYKINKLFVLFGNGTQIPMHSIKKSPSLVFNSLIYFWYILSQTFFLFLQKWKIEKSAFQYSSIMQSYHKLQYCNQLISWSSTTVGVMFMQSNKRGQLSNCLVNLATNIVVVTLFSELGLILLL